MAPMPGAITFRVARMALINGSYPCSCPSRSACNFVAGTRIVEGMIRIRGHSLTKSRGPFHKRKSALSRGEHLRQSSDAALPELDFDPASSSTAPVGLYSVNPRNVEARFG